MYEYPDLKEYANTYFRIERKLTAVKNNMDFKDPELVDWGRVEYNIRIL